MARLKVSRELREFLISSQWRFELTEQRKNQKITAACRRRAKRVKKPNHRKARRRIRRTMDEG